MIVCSVLVTIYVLISIAFDPRAGLLSLVLSTVPLFIVLPVLVWLDRVEPETWASRIHALAWGASVAGLVSVIVNTAVLLLGGSEFGEALAAVISAPLIEELSKGAGIIWAVRRKEVDGVMDGIVYAGWIGLGFAVIEDYSYFYDAAGDSTTLIAVFVVRAILTPFAHPLFTAWIGLAIGVAIARRQSIAANAFWGYGLAVATHATWNGSLVYADYTGSILPAVLAAVFFFLLFIAAAWTVFAIRRRNKQKFAQMVPFLAQRYGMTNQEVSIFADWQQTLRTRKAMPKSRRSQFDHVHAALARLALLHRRPGGLDQIDEQRLSQQLADARTVLARLEQI